MTAVGGTPTPSGVPPRPRSPRVTSPGAGERLWGGTAGDATAAGAADLLAHAPLGPGLKAIGIDDAQLLLGLGTEQRGARRLGARIDDVVTQVLRRECKDPASGAKSLANDGEDHYRLHVMTSPGAEGLCALDSLLMCLEQGSCVGWSQGESSTLPTREERHKFFKCARRLLKEGSPHEQFFINWARAHLGGTSNRSPANIGAPEATEALGPLRSCVAATHRDATGAVAGLNDLGFAILAYLLSVDIVRVDMRYDLTGTRPKLTQQVTLFPHCPPPERDASLRQRGRASRTNLRLPVFLLGISVLGAGQSGSPLAAHHVQPIVLVPHQPATGPRTTASAPGLEVRGARLLPWPGHAALTYALATTDLDATPARGHARFVDPPAARPAQGPLRESGDYLRPRHLSESQLPATATPDLSEESDARSTGNARHRSRNMQRRERQSRLAARSAPNLGTILDHPLVARTIHAIAGRPDLQAILMGLTNVPIPLLRDRTSVGTMLLEVLLMICPPEHDDLPKMPQPSARQERAITFLSVVLFPLLLGRAPRRRCPALSGGPAARAARFLHSPESAAGMLQALLGTDSLPEPPPAPRRPADPPTSAGGWCAVDKLMRLTADAKKIRDQFHAGNGAKAYNTATRAVAPPVPVVTPEDALANLQTLHPGCTSSGPSPIMTAPFEHGTRPGPAPGGDQVPDTRPLDERLDERPAFPSAELAAALTDPFLLSALRGMPRATTPGPFSPTTALLQELVRLAETEPLLERLPGRCCAFVRQYTLGKLPRLAHDLLTASTLIGIPKSDKGVRPIAMGDTWGKWGARCAVVAFRHRIREMFPTFQMGVMVDGGIEAVVLLHRLSLELRPEDVTLLLDMKNAFNSVSREAVLRAVRKRAPHLLDLVTRTLGHRSRLWLHPSCRPRTTQPEDASIWSTEGVRQGDAVSPLIFSLVMEDALDELRAALHKDEAASALIMAYLDDVSIRAPYRVICRILAVAKDIFAKYGLTLNPTKCVIFETPQARAAVDALRRTANETGPRYRLGPAGPGAVELVVTSDGGYVVLGTPVGADEYVLKELRGKVASLRLDAEALEMLGRDLLEPLMALSLIRTCFAHKIRHLARTVPPRLLLPVGREFDDLTAQTVLGMLREHNGLDDEMDDSYLALARLRIFRAVFKGGLSVRSTAVAARAAYTAATLQALPVVADIVSHTQTWKALLPLHGTLSERVIDRLIGSAPCLQAALGERQWGRWKSLAARNGHASDIALSETGQVHGAMAPDPGNSGGAGHAPSSASVLASMSVHQAVRGALAGHLPRRLQHVLTTLEEAERDRLLEERLKAQAISSLSLSKRAWGSSAPLSPALAYLHLLACSGPGHEWILDSTRRSHKKGGPPRIALYHSDGALDGPTAIVALRAHLLLPLGGIYHAAQAEQGIDTLTRQPPRCFCRARCDEHHARHLDYYGLHLMTRVLAAQYTYRHNEYVGALASLLRRAGFLVSIEKHPFRELPDLEDLPEESGDEGAGARAAAVDRSMRLDAVVEAVPVDILRRVDASLVSHLPSTTTTARVLIDATFTHPGPFLHDTRLQDSGAVFGDVDAMGEAAVKGKRDKYLARSIEAGYVLLPYHCNVYGRLHPIASRFLDAIVDLVVLRRGALGAPRPPSAQSSDTSFKRSLVRGLSIHLRRTTVMGLIASVRAARPRFRADTIASLPLGARVPTRNASVVSPVRPPPLDLPPVSQESVFEPVV